ncbi:hypothetical protein [uncultured Lamprocystis sp.]|jgi:hypothetical protein|nr:hypothetical protein [uncultured Lamprocystis sp.]
MKRIADTLPEQKDIRTQSQNLIADDDSAVRIPNAIPCSTA